MLSSSVCSRFQRIVVVCTIILGMGVHWSILQSVAWTGMVISYSQGTSFKEGLEKTFDGKHPCTLCKWVKAGQRSEQGRDRQELPLNLDLFVHSLPAQLIFGRKVEESCPVFQDFYRWSKESPPIPPPMVA
jgi:hypothetical protein